MRSSIVSYCCIKDGQKVEQNNISIPNKLILRKLNNLRTNYRADFH